MSDRYPDPLKAIPIIESRISEVFKHCIALPFASQTYFICVTNAVDPVTKPLMDTSVDDNNKRPGTRQRLVNQ
ncbi:unnamed protein product [Oppiella nova]|uniref:Uncharacterized protein n=1 Tax=Oppiella nova TaxID=334625 RepID=A0A7R9LRD8_9ACAR|nr:unnamed protein product [Oppiella nova]CAG2166155.1 unnamed protein product [Oppiella nova]